MSAERKRVFFGTDMVEANVDTYPSWTIKEKLSSNYLTRHPADARGADAAMSRNQVAVE